MNREPGTASGSGSEELPLPVASVVTDVGPPPLPAAVAAPADTPAAAPPVDETARVRSVLAQYEAAYSALNVAAARAVWPNVDAPALARAFEGLESQRVSLGRCSFDIAGSAARANCTGSTRWTPKVGGGTRTEARHWTFELMNDGGDWRIVRAEAR